LHNERPAITLSYAQSLDGSIAPIRGSRYTVSCAESRELTHRLRAAHDAILVGINTVVADNPCLTVRLVEGQNPLPIVLDSRLRMPLDSNLLKNNLPPLIATTNSASREKQARIEEYGAKIMRFLPDERGWVDLHLLLNRMTDLGIDNIMVEGGARVITSFLSHHLVDRIVITIAPAFLGGLRAIEYPLATCRQGSSGLTVMPEFTDCRFEQVGKDIVFSAALSWSNQ
jgi:3,4-dihydroxy 2-butanone 4-phosphate synthase/GTP cyclohydrolase II